MRGLRGQLVRGGSWRPGHPPRGGGSQSGGPPAGPPIHPEGDRNYNIPQIRLFM